MADTPNKQQARCPTCGYTEEDMRIHGDHHLCKGPGPVSLTIPDEAEGEARLCSAEEEAARRSGALSPSREAVKAAKAAVVDYNTTPGSNLVDTLARALDAFRDEGVLELAGIVEERLAAILAKRRTGGSVFMDNSHMPLPQEKRAARDIRDELLLSLAPQEEKAL